ncbi:MAG: endonuclease/exonuclease/phosphatase family protein [Elusimicrobia bacterium]|jgi:endonuclease/exonuclease/phosphatase family metal-dependent hydrolase|nr:endonuclease/exonuclease/phosphatase family protein [Elusimicrobiota bacterium]
MKLRVLTINLHKGFSPLNRRFVLPQLRACVHSATADIIFLQEVVGENLKKAARHKEWPAKAQHEYLAEPSGFEHVYGKNAVYSYGHHGNAILSRFPILFFDRADISTNRLEKRGMLYARLKLPGDGAVNCICVHLGLLARSRDKQLRKVREYIQKFVPPGEPLIVAGDFNEWRRNKADELETRLLMKDAGLAVYGHKLKTFPSVLPVFPLDRIYLRGFKALKARVLRKGVCGRLSDHAGFLAKVELKG